MRLLLALVSLLSSQAFANLGAVTRDPAIGGLTGTAGTPLEVRAETLDFNCRAVGEEPICRFVATYDVVNPTTQPQRATVAFIGTRTDEVEVVESAKAIHRVLSAEEAAPFLAEWNDAFDPRAAALEFTLEPGAATTITATGILIPGRLTVPSYLRDATVIRHPLFGARTSRPTTFDLDYLISPLRSWAGSPRVSVSVTTPDAWGAPEVTVNDTGASSPRVVTGTDFVLESSVTERLSIRVTLPRPRLFAGGIMVGLGGTVLAPSGLRFRLGGEFAAPGWLLWSLCVETNFTNQYVVVPAAEAVVDSLLNIIPSFGFGLGVPVRIMPSPGVGGRAQVSLHWPWVGAVFALDVFPAQRSAVQFSIYAQVGL
ncbi:MAG: hypothetical protein Q8L14_14915 [Myxococcales bacterium]|nr:hypothetical protein [Myxococcales bacterium]